MSLFPLQSKQSRQSWQSAEVPCCGRVDRLRSRWTEQWVALTLSRRLSLSAITKSYYYGHDLCLWFIIWLWWLLYCNHYIYTYTCTLCLCMFYIHILCIEPSLIPLAGKRRQVEYIICIYIIIIYNIGLPSTHQRQSKQEQSNAMSLPGWFLDNMIFGWEPL
jgi:hypothetical protein